MTKQQCQQNTTVDVALRQIHVSSTHKPNRLQRDVVANTFEDDHTNAIYDDDAASFLSTHAANAGVDPFAYTTEQKWTVELLKLLDDFNAPDKAFAEIIRWAQASLADGYLFRPPGGLS
ncbi:MAG: hypothetical protein ACRC1D_01365, partial [Culicoidibacterales bacterium]